ncbi:hypothetical protein BIV59_17455 [Bacillus sp. MUM 13]|nr:hypothetical protein BIV59_17455 [Bacillus sp. MUM 13]
MFVYDSRILLNKFPGSIIRKRISRSFFFVQLFLSTGKLIGIYFLFLIIEGVKKEIVECMSKWEHHYSGKFLLNFYFKRTRQKSYVLKGWRQ